MPGLFHAYLIQIGHNGDLHGIFKDSAQMEFRNIKVRSDVLNAFNISIVGVDIRNNPANQCVRNLCFLAFAQLP